MIFQTTPPSGKRMHTLTWSDKLVSPLCNQANVDPLELVVICVKIFKTEKTIEIQLVMLTEVCVKY